VELLSKAKRQANHYGVLKKFAPGVYMQLAGHNFFCKRFAKFIFMSQAFVRESDEQWLHDVPPTLNALLVYLTRENNGIRVYEQNVHSHPESGRAVHFMSNGLAYAKDEAGRWCIEW